MQDFRKLRVWNESQQLCADVIRLTARLRHIGSLRAQVRSSSESIPSNIAAGSRKESPIEFAHYLVTSAASASECESQLDLLNRLRVTDPKRVGRLIQDVVRIRRQILALRKRVLEGDPNPRRQRPKRTPNPEPQNPKPPTDLL